MIRKATSEDLNAVAEIYDHIHQQGQEKKQYTGWIPNVYPTIDTARQALEREDLFVYEEHGEILASAIINQTQVDAYADGNWKYNARASEIMVLHTLTVEPAAAGTGIGTKLVAFYEDYAREAGCRVLRIDTNAKNTTARRLYAKLGYREADIVPCVFNNIPNVDLVLLEKLCSPQTDGDL